MERKELILAIETSCDETSAAVIEEGKLIRANVVASQMESHARFGGVVPEVASRHHVEQMTRVVEEAMEQADISYADLAAVSVTEGPGLVGALLIGVETAKALAFAHGLPLIGVHHIAGHIYANQLVRPLEFPALALVVSGGHTEFIYMEEEGLFEVIGQTRDDAVGEAYDKVARTLGLPYPGGPQVDRLAAESKESIKLPRAWLEKESYDFSFSGLKSAVINTLHNQKQRGAEVDKAALARGFQESVIEVLTVKTERAAKAYGVKQVLLAGGVAANKGLRSSLKETFEGENVDVIVPPLSLCTDNAAMIGACASMMYKKGHFSDMAMNARPGMPLRSY
ncbi:tRNA (adenosine(37)-N6)-threonylcarbamoyltransferase complex transferase subunit TsaD [Shouchella shacheensis]|uniref:tRNA (adenosine(37)-N6)-threonylcarbamoyltransferase complex transferase subunit TsaD n=1 Tax=Shouchella shacheensis TaxID=1649580 RepID=UPI00074037D8|nr:tRNA (adenosine(37)-N6)-threonylcarbamoyltransferase complex transferase subunit TsaD [Shouchella shacheensis]